MQRTVAYYEIFSFHEIIQKRCGDLFRKWPAHRKFPIICLPASDDTFSEPLILLNLTRRPFGFFPLGRRLRYIGNADINCQSHEPPTCRLTFDNPGLVNEPAR